MAFNFPNTPTVGQTVTLGGITYTWNGYAWAGGPASDTSVYVLRSGDSMGGALSLVGDATTALHAVPKQQLDAGALADRKYAQLCAQRNLLYNGDFKISQVANYGAVTVGEAGDGWQIAGVPANGTAQVVAVYAPLQRGQYRLQVKCTVAKTTLAATDYWEVYHYVEGVDNFILKPGTTQGVRALLRFGFKGPAGVYGVSAYNAPTTDIFWSGSFTVTAGNANTDQIYYLQIPPPPVGSTWNLAGNSVSLAIIFGLAAGSTYTGTMSGAWGAVNRIMPPGGVNGFSSTSNVFELFDVALVPDFDNLNVDPGFTPNTYESELARCMRYYIKGFTCQASGYAATAGYGLQYPVYWPVPMRTTPTRALRAAGSGGGTSVDLSPASTMYGVFLFISPAGGTAAAYGYVYDLDARM
jgi:hypothetical protein